MNMQQTGENLALYDWIAAQRWGHLIIQIKSRCCFKCGSVGWDNTEIY